MNTLSARLKIKQSISHWGLFYIPQNRIVFTHEDRGLEHYTNDYVSVFTINQVKYLHRYNAANMKDKREASERMKSALELLSKLGIDTDSIDYDHEK